MAKDSIKTSSVDLWSLPQETWLRSGWLAFELAGTLVGNATFSLLYDFACALAPLQCQLTWDKHAALLTRLLDLSNAELCS